MTLRERYMEILELRLRISRLQIKQLTGRLPQKLGPGRPSKPKRKK